MLDWFKKNKTDVTVDIQLMTNVFERLGDEFSNIKEQLQSGIILSSTKVNTPFPNYIKFRHNSEVLSRYEDEKGRYYSLSGITLLDQNHLINLKINVGFGILLGYSIGTNDLISPVLDTINTEYFKVEYHDDESLVDEVRLLLGDESLKFVNTSDIYNVFVKGERFIHLKEVTDGDFIGVNKSGAFYKITHDPLGIEEIKDGFNLLIGE